MLAGTKKLFPTDYDEFRKAMIDAAENDDLPVALQLDDVKDYTLKDVQDMFQEFNQDTGLDIDGSLFLCSDCGKLHFLIEVSEPEVEEERILQ